MNPTRWKRVEAAFHAAIDAETGERGAVLDRECAGDEDLRAEVERLLDADERASTLIDTPIGHAFEAAATEADGGPALEDGALLGPWRIRREIASGGMGTVYLATRADGEYEQEVAVKLIRRGLPRADLLERFKAERQTLALLSHPSIARLLDGGATPDGRPYLVMELVDGRPIDEYCDANALSLDARLRLFRTVCEAVQHAHRNLVVHRDLKPSNILVTKDGTPKLLDFGIAKALPPDSPGLAADAALVTHARVMTPAYASPEQVRGLPVTTATDVWSLGVLLYELLTGLHPHRRSATSAPYEMEHAICEEEPERPSRVVAPGKGPIRSPLSADLDAIVLKALRKEPELRYESASRFAEDISRYLDGLPVLARAGGFSYRARKFVRRHRVAAVAAALLFASVAASVVGISVSAGVARERLADILRLSDLTRLSGFLSEADDLWPNRADAVTAMESWLSRARELGSRLALHRATLEDVRARQTAASAADDPRFDATEDAWQHDLLSKLVGGLEALIDPDSGTIALVEERLEFARTVTRRSLEDPAAEWDRATFEIADIVASPAYGGLVISPQKGLVPLSRDPITGFHEFAHLATGDVAVRGPDGELVLVESTGLVLVLLPGGTFAMGAEPPRTERPLGSPNADPLAAGNEGPVTTVTLEPFFISKYEMSQGQWLRATRKNPSLYRPGYPNLPQPNSTRHPVESVSWDECDFLLPRLGLAIPTEAQWEYAARAGTTTPWWTGSDARSLNGSANVADVTAAKAKAPWMAGLPKPLFDDGFTAHAPVEGYRPNPFGLLNVAGNVSEWARDGFAYYRVPPRPLDGERPSDDPRRVARGGNFIQPPDSVRSTVRMLTSRDFRAPTIGVRPARPVDR